VSTSPNRGALCALVLALLATSQVARAQVPAADAAFQRGREALKVGKYDEACVAFEESQALDPQLTTQFNIALCDEQLGKLASALAIYKELAAKDDNPSRRAKAGEMIVQLEARAARLRIEIAENRRRGDALVPPGLEVIVNGVRATNYKDMPIDLGTSKVQAHAPGYLEWVGTVTAKDEKQRVVVTITLDPDPSTTPQPVLPPPTPPPPHEQPAPRSTRRTLALVGIIGGGAAIAGSFTFGLLARSKWHDAKDVCGGTICDTQADLDRGKALADSARTRGTVATVLAIGGGALVAGGIVLWMTAPKAERSVAIAPSASSSSVGLALLGTF
jgi:hypothetical protein